MSDIAPTAVLLPGQGSQFAQPAIFCASLAGWARVSDRVGLPMAFAGHSLGELSALAAAGARSYLDPGPGAVLAKLAPRCVPGAQPLELPSVALQRAA